MNQFPFTAPDVFGCIFRGRPGPNKIDRHGAVIGPAEMWCGRVVRYEQDNARRADSALGFGVLQSGLCPKCCSVLGAVFAAGGPTPEAALADLRAKAEALVGK